MNTMRTFLALLIVGLLLPCIAMAEQFTLVCHLMSPGVPPIDRNMVVDLDKSLVDDRPAVISDTVITRQITDSDGVTVRMIINRVTGAIELSDSKQGIFLTGHCVKATQRQF